MTVLDENKYKVDFEISNGYINFSAELLRLSLLAMGGFGGLILTKFEGDGTAHGFLANPILFLISMTFFSLCAGATLFHRYFASDCMSWYVAWLRADSLGNTEKAQKEKKGFYRMLRLSKIALITAECLFGAAVLFFIVAIYQLILY